MRTGPNPRPGVLRGAESLDTHTGEGGPGRVGAGTGVKLLQPREPESPAALATTCGPGRGVKCVLLQSPQEGTGPLTPWFQIGASGTVREKAAVTLRPRDCVCSTLFAAAPGN